jgi:sporulation protein YlmC with PRC-barrel domain
MQRQLLSSSTLVGDKVRNSAGEHLGKIEELMIDVNDGRVGYAVLSFGGFAGLGSRLFAIPWSLLRVDQPSHEFVLNIERSILENAPGFDRDHWPDLADPSLGAQIHGHYDVKPYWEELASAPR